MINLTSEAFKQGGSIPKKYTCQGENLNPSLTIENVPSAAKSLVLIMEDPDVPKNLKADGMFDHWVVFNMPSTLQEIISNFQPQGTIGANSRGEAKYTGPCPPDKEHRYFFKIFALDTVLNLPEGSSKKQIEDAMQSHILDQGELMGKYIKS